MKPKLLAFPFVRLATLNAILLVYSWTGHGAEDYLPRPVDQENFTDGSMGWETEFQGVGSHFDHQRTQ
jgi:hypothetical protein